MTKQEEIREGIISKVKSIRLWADNPEDPLSAEDDADDILDMLHSQDVVIKVDRELPFGSLSCQLPPVKEAVITMLNAGYVAVEPLIKE